MRPRDFIKEYYPLLDKLFQALKRSDKNRLTVVGIARAIPMHDIRLPELHQESDEVEALLGSSTFPRCKSRQGGPPLLRTWNDLPGDRWPTSEPSLPQWPWTQMSSASTGLR